MFKPPLVKSGRHGDWSIEAFEVTEHDAALFCMSQRGRTRLRAGTYYRLMERGTVWMSNTPDEYVDHMGFISDAKGNVLIVGIGMGLVLREVLDKANVSHVTVVEKDFSVISLVGMAFMSNKKYRDKVSIVQADLWEWWPTKEMYGKFDCAWVDIWDNYNEEMLVEFKKARYHLNAVCMGQKVGCWKETELKRGRRQ